MDLFTRSRVFTHDIRHVSNIFSLKYFVYVRTLELDVLDRTGLYVSSLFN